MRCRSPVSNTKLRKGKTALSLLNSKDQTLLQRVTYYKQKKTWLISATHSSYLAACEVGVLGQLDVQSLQEDLVRDFAHIHAGFIQNREDAFMLLLHQVNNNLVVEVINLQKRRSRIEVNSVGKTEMSNNYMIKVQTKHKRKKNTRIKSFCSKISSRDTSIHWPQM